MSEAGRNQVAMASIRAEDDALGNLMYFIRTLNGKEEVQKVAVAALLRMAIELEKKFHDSARAEEFETAFGFEAATFGCVAIMQRATEEWERFDREGPE